MSHIRKRRKIMNRLFKPEIKYTDPGQLLFCLPISEHEFWFCEVASLRLKRNNKFKILALFKKYFGHPQKLLGDADLIQQVKEAVLDITNWERATIDVREIDQEDRAVLYYLYSLKPKDFSEGTERNQMIAKMCFEINITGEM